MLTMHAEHAEEMDIPRLLSCWLDTGADDTLAITCRYVPMGLLNPLDVRRLAVKNMS